MLYTTYNDYDATYSTLQRRLLVSCIEEKYVTFQTDLSFNVISFSCSVTWRLVCHSQRR